MEEFTIEIACFPAQIRCAFSSTPEYFRRYRSENAPQEILEITQTDRLLEQQLLDEEADREHLRRRRFTEPFLERSAIQRKMAECLQHQNDLLLHGSTVAVDGIGYLFTASTGVGKSTHTRFWMEVFGDRALMVNDDRAFLRISPRGVTVYGSPWSGKHGLDSNVCLPLGGICILERGTENRIVPISPEQALPALLGQAFQVRSGEYPTELTVQLAASVPLWHMACTKEPKAAAMAHDAMAAKVPEIAQTLALSK